MAQAATDDIQKALKAEGLPEAKFRPKLHNYKFQGRWTRGLQVLTGFIILRGKWTAEQRAAALERLRKHFLVTHDEEGYTARVKEA